MLKTMKKTWGKLFLGTQVGIDSHFGQFPSEPYRVSINPNIDYSLKVCIQGNRFACFLNGEEALSLTDDAYSSGQVGLHGQKADVFFDNFTVYSLP